MCGLFALISGRVKEPLGLRPGGWLTHGFGHSGQFVGLDNPLQLLGLSPADLRPAGGVRYDQDARKFAIRTD